MISKLFFLLVFFFFFFETGACFIAQTDFRFVNPLSQLPVYTDYRFVSLCKSSILTVWVFVFCFETGSRVTQVGLELGVYPWLDFNS